MENADKPPTEKPSEPYPYYLENAIREFSRHVPLIIQGIKERKQREEALRKPKPPKPPETPEA